MAFLVIVLILGVFAALLAIVAVMFTAGRRTLQEPPFAPPEARESEPPSGTPGTPD